ncbi:FHA domain-containing protein [Pseudomonadota bacterium]
MGRLTITSEGVAAGEYPLVKERVIIGRQLDCEIHIDDLAVSGKHATIITIMNDSFLEDGGSTNGTYVNGSLVKKCPLKDGDLIGIGNHVLKYAKDEESDESDFEKTMVIRPGMPAHKEASSQQAHAIEKAEGEASQSAIQMTASVQTGRLKVLTGPAKDKELELSKALVTLGRPGVQVAVISRRRQGYFLTHIEGAGGGKKFPLVNGEPIGPHAQSLKNHDVIELAGVEMEFLVGD